MNKLFLTVLLFLLSTVSKAQTALGIEWEKSYGGTNHETARCGQRTWDGGYIVAGMSMSNDVDVVSGNFGGNDIWVTKLNSNGTLDWENHFGGTEDDHAYSIQQTADGGYIIAGYTQSNNNDIATVANHGGKDYWVIKINSTGSLIWETAYGGTGEDIAYSVRQTSDGGYIVAGISDSNDGDVSSGNHGYQDAWVIKLTSSGAITWERSIGGSSQDVFNSIIQTSDGNYVCAGYSGSSDGDLSYSLGAKEFWIVKLNSSGTALIWSKSYGGDDVENAQSIVQTADGGFAVAGWASDNSGDVTGHHGFWDYWVVKLDGYGDLQWQKSFGGSDIDVAYAIKQTADGGYIVGGYSGSNDGDVSNPKGLGWSGGDYWIVKLKSTGELVWEKSIGGSNEDYLFSLDETPDGYILFGRSNSNDGDVTVNNGYFDYWVVKLNTCSSIVNYNEGTVPSGHSLYGYINAGSSCGTGGSGTVVNSPSLSTTFLAGVEINLVNEFSASASGSGEFNAIIQPCTNPLAKPVKQQPQTVDLGRPAIIDAGNAKAIIYPNPAHEMAYLDFNNRERGQIQIKVVNSLGTVVKLESIAAAKNQQNQHVPLNLSMLPKGMYFIQIIDKKGIMKTLRLEKQ